MKPETNTDAEIIYILRPHLYESKHKKGPTNKVAGVCNLHLTKVFKDMIKFHPVNAVWRTAESMGVQEMHAVENKNPGKEIGHIIQGAGNDPIDQRTIVFGNKEEGIGLNVKEHAEGAEQIPVKGCTKSFNPSASASIILDSLLTKGYHKWEPSEKEQDRRIAEGFGLVVRESDNMSAYHQKRQA